MCRGLWLPRQGLVLYLGLRSRPPIGCSESWIRCYECNPPAALRPKDGVTPHKATVLTFARGARVRKPAPVDNDLPPTA